MRNQLDEKRLQHDNEIHGGSGGCSQGNRHHGFRPAFLDFATQRVYDSRFADGRPAPFHLLDGLPDEVVLERSVTGRVLSAKSTLICGFVRHGFFYTRRAAARAVAEWPGAPGR